MNKSWEVLRRFCPWRRMGIPFHRHATERAHKEVASDGVREGLTMVAVSLTRVVENVNGDGVRIPLEGNSRESSTYIAVSDAIEIALSPAGMTSMVGKVAKEEK